MAAALARLLPPSSFTRQVRTRSMIKIDPHNRIDLTGPCSGFGFQGGHMFTLEGRQLEPCDMAWWSLTCNIAREWRLMMAEARIEVATRSVPPRMASATTKSSVSTLPKCSEFGENDGWPGCIRPRRRAIQCGLYEPWAEVATAHVRRFRRGAAPTPRFTAPGSATIPP